jgi:hypothetical protein
MTTPKRSLALQSRTPAYVSRETGAAELMISPETWDRWVDEGILPKPAPHMPSSTPRWRWADVDRKLAGATDTDADTFVSSAARLRDGAPKGPRRATS